MPTSDDPSRPAAAPLRCAPWTEAQGVDPIGSATTFDALLLVEWPLPWPSDVGLIPPLARAASDGRARVMAVVPRADRGGDGLVCVVHHRRAGSHRLVGVDHRVRRHEVPALLDALLEAIDDDTSGWPSAVGVAPTEILVCGHGRRDPCCGRWGTLLHAELDGRWSDVRVWRCSHTGGHRFAPTAITLPDGRSWAYVDVELLEGVVRRTGALRALAPHDRGTAGLPMWAQPLERALFGRIGWGWLDHEITGVSVEVTDDATSAAVELRWHDPGGASGRALGTVEVTRTIPVLVCGEPPEAATKTSSELALRSVEIS